jgi:hypothetical protein
VYLFQNDPGRKLASKTGKNTSLKALQLKETTFSAFSVGATPSSGSL